MSVFSLLALLLLCYQLLVHTHSAEEPNHDCTKSFTCGKLGNLGYPFTSKACPQQDWLTIFNCDDQPRIQLQPGTRGLRVESISQSDIISINDESLRHSLDSTSCNYFQDLDLPKNPFLSFHFNSLPIFKCNQTQFDPNLSHVNCSGASGYEYSFYYSYHHGESMIIPPHCSVIQIPADQRPLEANTSELFSLFLDRFDLTVQINENCISCHHLGGQCEQDSKGRFHCAKREKKGLRLHSKLLVLAISAGGIGTLLAMLALIYRVRHTTSVFLSFWKRKRGKDDEKIESLLRACGPLCQKRYSYLEIKKMTESFKDKLGEGGFGGVYKGNLSDDRSVAVKVLKASKGNGEEFINEVLSISKTSHVNIVSLLGFCFEGHRRALVYEFMANGSLEKFIYKESSVGVSVNRTLEWEALFKIAVGIARGLEYLHLGCNTRILHFDIKPHNILLDKEFRPKISDFGLAKVCPRKESIISMLGARGTAGYIAPEVVCRNIGGVSHKSDVYSYGMMVLEMVGGRRNIDCGAENTSEIYFPHWIYNRVVSERGFVRGGSAGLEEEDCVRKMVVVSLWCVQTEPSKRPSMSMVVEMLEGRVGSLEDPPKPF